MTHPKISLTYTSYVKLQSMVSSVSEDDLIDFASYGIEMHIEHKWPIVAYGVGSAATWREFNTPAYGYLYNRAVVLKELTRIMDDVRNSTN